MKTYALYHILVKVQMKKNTLKGFTNGKHMSDLSGHHAYRSGNIYKDDWLEGGTVPSQQDLPTMHRTPAPRAQTTLPVRTHTIHRAHRAGRDGSTRALLCTSTLSAREPSLPCTLH